MYDHINEEFELEKEIEEINVSIEQRVNKKERAFPPKKILEDIDLDEYDRIFEQSTRKFDKLYKKHLRKKKNQVN